MKGWDGGWSVVGGQGNETGEGESEKYADRLGLVNSKASGAGRVVISRQYSSSSRCAAKTVLGEGRRIDKPGEEKKAEKSNLAEASLFPMEGELKADGRSKGGGINRGVAGGTSQFSSGSRSSN